MDGRSPLAGSPTVARGATVTQAWDLDGPADAPLVVFIHGTRLTRASWRAITDRLRGEYRCLSVDLPAHGALAHVPFTLDAATDAVLAAIAAAGERRAILVGLSLGGYVAMATAARDPDCVRGLVLAGATAEPAGPAGAVFRLFAWALGVAPERPLDAVNAWFLRRRYPPEIADPIIASGFWSRGGAQAVRAIARPGPAQPRAAASGRARSETARSGPPSGFRDRLAAYGGPTLVVNGDLDLVFRLGERRFTRGIPHLRRRVLPWTTHLSPLDRPDRFAAEVRAFAASLPR